MRRLGILRPMTAVADPEPGSPEPERGLLLAVLPKGVDAEDELAELRELARTAGVEPVGRARAAPPAPRPADLRRQGQARGAEGRVRRARGGGAPRRRRARADAAARARGRARRPRRRPDAADPRHLRPARRLRRGEAAGRARAARVQPAAHARHVEAPRAPRRRGRDPRPRRVAARDRPAACAKRRIRCSSGGCARSGAHRATRRKERRALGDADGRARRLHERRQVDAAERAHGRRGLRREPPVRDARPDDPRLRRTTASATSSPTRSASSGACRHSSSRASRRRSRRRSSPTSSSTSSTRRCPRTARASRSTRSRRVLAEIGAGDVPVELVLNKIDLLDPLAPPARREPVSRRDPGLGRDGRGSRRAEGRGSRSASPTGSTTCACSCRTTRGACCPSCTRSARRSRSGRTPRRASLVRARLPHREVRRFAPYLVAEARDGRRSRRRCA